MAHMHRVVVAIALLAIPLSGCVDNTPTTQNPPHNTDSLDIYDNISANTTVIVDFDYWSQFGTDLVGLDYVEQLCNDEEVPGPIEGGFYSKAEIPRIDGSIITRNHTELKVQYQVDDVFADSGISGLRIGAYYNHEFIFWSESFKEDSNFTIALNGMYDEDKDARWTFFTKHTDPTTEDDKDACTSGFTSGSYQIKIEAV